MKSRKKSLVIILSLAIFVLGSVLTTVGVVGAETIEESGIPGLDAPAFIGGLIRAIAAGEAGAKGTVDPAVLNNAPWAITGFAMSKWEGGIHVWISSCSDNVKALGYEPGDIVAIICSEEQVKDVNSGDFVRFVGITVRGFLVRVNDVALPAPFSY